MNIIQKEQPIINYRDIKALNASSIKLFAKNRNQFYREVVLGEKRKDKQSDAIVLGSLIDYFLTECQGDEAIFQQKFDEKFALLSVKKGSGQLFNLADYFYEYTLKDSDENGNIVSTFLDRFTEAFNRCQSEDMFKGKKLEDTITKFTESDAKTYLDEKLKSVGKMVVDEWMLNKSKQCVESVMKDENVNWIFDKNREGIENFGKTVIEFEHMDLECKAELDNVIINHSNREILITEVKSSWDIEDGFEYTYLKLGYYISAAFYIKGVNYLKNQAVSYFPKDYAIKFQFLTIDSSPLNLKPLIRTFSVEDYRNAELGFTINGRKYYGLNELIEEIKWCNEYQIWNQSKESYENNSVLPLKLKYD